MDTPGEITNHHTVTIFVVDSLSIDNITKTGENSVSMKAKGAYMLLDGELVPGSPIIKEVQIKIVAEKLIHMEVYELIKHKGKSVTIITDGKVQINVAGKDWYTLNTYYKYIKLTQDKLPEYKNRDDILYVNINGTYANVYGIDLLAKFNGTKIDTTHPLLKDITEYYKRTISKNTDGGKSLRRIKKSRKNKLKSKKSRRRFIKI